MKVLIISRSFYPMNTPRSFRTTELAVELANRGLDVTVCINYKPEIHDNFIKENNLKIINLNGFNIENRNHSIYKRYILRITGILFEYPSILYTKKVKEVVIKNYTKFDIIISIAVPHTIHWGVAAAIKKEKKFTWIADCGDPYMGNKMDKYNKPFYFKYIEKWWCRKADYITVPIPEAKNAYYPEFDNKIKVIPQGINFDKIKSHFIGYSKQNKIQFLYAGSFIENFRDPRPLLEYLNSTEIDFKFYIFSKDKRLTSDLAAKSKGRVELMNPITREQILGIMSTMDFLLNIENGVSEVSPSKLIEYALTERPILTVDSNNLDIENINKFLNRDFSNAKLVKNINDYDIVKVVDQFLSLHKR